MLNTKMKNMAHYLGASLWKSFPQNYLDSLFIDGTFCDYDIVLQVMVEGCKYAYDYYDGEPKGILGKHPLKYYIDNAPEQKIIAADKTDTQQESLRGVMQRALSDVNTWKKEYSDLLDDYCFDHSEAFLPPKMSTAKDKFAGYDLTAIQYWEIKDYHDTAIEKDIVRGSAFKKNYKYETFVNNINAYDDILANLKKHWLDSNELTVMNSIKAFLLEWNYSIQFFYKLAVEMEQKGVDSIAAPVERKVIFCGPLIKIPAFELRYATSYIETDSRLLLMRDRFIPTIVTEGDIKPWTSVEHLFLEFLFLQFALRFCLEYEGETIQEWFLHHTTIEDWASVFREYNIFHEFPVKKEWTRKTVKNMKYLMHPEKS